MSKNGIAIKGTMDFDSVSAFLGDLVKSFNERQIFVQRGDEFVKLVPADVVELELEATLKKGKQKLSIELEWRDEVITEAEAPFKVSSKEPEIKVEAPENPCEPVVEAAQSAASDIAPAEAQKKQDPSTSAAKVSEKKDDPKSGAAAKK